MDGQNYVKILDAMQETGVYVIREDDHRILFLNQRVRRVTPAARVGLVCHELWSDSCDSCPLRTIAGKQESRSVCYNSPFGRVVDIVASRIDWDGIPAFVITLTPHTEISGYVYHRLFRVNLADESYELVRLGHRKESWAVERDEPLSAWMERFIQKGRLHPQDVERFRAFVQPSHLLQAFRAGRRTLTCTYRRWLDGSFHWNMLEAVPDYSYTEENPVALLYAKDVHDVLREGLEREDSSIRRQEIIRALGEQNFGIYVVDLDTGLADPVRVEGQMQPLGGERLVDWESKLRPQLQSSLHWEYQDAFACLFSLDSLRRMAESCETRQELLCQREMEEGLFGYISVSACFSQERDHRRYAVLAFQDTDARVRQELERSQWDMQMAAILKCRYSFMNTVHLDTGLCERIDLHQAASTRGSLSDDYNQHVRHALSHLVLEEDADRFRSAMSLEHIRQRALEVETYAEDICQYRTRETVPRWLEQHVVYSRQAGEVMVNILGRDVTTEKAREAAQRDRDQEKMDIIHSLSTMFFSTCYINLAEDTFQSVTQLRESDNFLGARVQYTAGIRSYAEKRIHPDDREDYLAVMSVDNLRAQLGPQQRFLAVEYRQQSEDGELCWIRATAVLVRSDEMGRPLTAVCAAQDVTESKQKEAREHQVLHDAYQAANQANAAKSEFLSRMSHDIRTPMNGIIGMTGIALSHLDDPARMEDCLKKISVSSRHLLNLVNEVLDMSQIESGRIDLAEERISLPELIADLSVILRSPIQERGHELRIHLQELPHPLVLGDAARLQQVFVNILGNSVKYTPPGGLLEIEVREKESRQHGLGCYEFIFRDNGVGMTEEFVHRIFEPFSRAEDSRTSAIEGTGLGMTIAQNLVRMFGGGIAVKSAPGKGSQFAVTLFLRQLENPAESPVKEPTAISLQGRRLLLAEDNLLNQEIACELLEDAGAVVECVDNGLKAVQRLEETPPGYYDMVLLDIMMPVMNGLEAARAIRALPRQDAAALPIIAMSANAFAEDIAASREAGMNDHLTKPLDVAVLLSRIDHWLNQT